MRGRGAAWSGPGGPHGCRRAAQCPPARSRDAPSSRLAAESCAAAEAQVHVKRCPEGSRASSEGAAWCAHRRRRPQQRLDAASARQTSPSTAAPAACLRRHRQRMSSGNLLRSSCRRPCAALLPSRRGRWPGARGESSVATGARNDGAPWPLSPRHMRVPSPRSRATDRAEAQAQTRHPLLPCTCRTASSPLRMGVERGVRRLGGVCVPTS